MHPRKEIAQRRASLHRRTVWKSGGVHHPRHRLNRQIHRGIAAIGAVAAIPRTCRIDQPRVLPLQHGCTKAKPVHGARRIILDHHIRRRGQRQKRRLAVVGLQVEHDRFLATVQHGERQRRAPNHPAPPQRLAGGRFDLDDPRSGCGHQKGRIGAVVDLAQVDHHDALQRLVGNTGGWRHVKSPSRATRGGATQGGATRGRALRGPPDPPGTRRVRASLWHSGCCPW